jgi:predicted SprT family Zn-dependent metalloprotease
MNETTTEYTTLQEAYQILNKEIFNSELPECLITYQTGKSFRAYYHQDIYKSRSTKKRIDEIAMNPETFEGRTDKEILGTLLHEMAHTWQGHFGKPSRNGYHNSEWGNKMESIGLMPSDNEGKDGKRTGQRMSHYIIKDGLYEEVYRKRLMLKKLNWQKISPDKKAVKPKDRKIKYTCPECKQNAWGKPNLNIICGECSNFLEEILVQMEAEE